MRSVSGSGRCPLRSASGAEVDRFRDDFAGLRHPPVRRLPPRHEVRGREGRPAAGNERQAARKTVVRDVLIAHERQQAEVVGALPHAELPVYRGEIEQRELRPEARGHVLEREIGGELGEPPVVDREPEAQRAATAPHFDRVIDPRLPGRQVDVVQRGIQTAVPLGELLDGAPHQVAAHVERGRVFARRLGAQRETVVTPVVLEHEIQTLELQRRCAPHLVAPFDLSVADDDLALREDPVGGAAFRSVGGAQLQAGDEEPALRIAADAQVRPVEHERLEAQLAGRDRVPGHARAHVREHQRLLAAAVVNLDPAEFEPRMQAVPLGIDPLDGDFRAERARNRRGNLVLVIGDPRQRPEPQHEHRHRGEEIQPDERPSRAAQPREPAALARRELFVQARVERVVDDFLDLVDGVVERVHPARGAQAVNGDIVRPRWPGWQGAPTMARVETAHTPSQLRLAEVAHWDWGSLRGLWPP